jgi:hypothetical protein
MKILTLIAALALVNATTTRADQQTATVSTPSGTYTVPVEVVNGNVTHVDWPNGGHMSVNGGQLSGGQADGRNSRGDSVHINLNGGSPRN